MIALSNLLSDIPYTLIQGSLETMVVGIQDNSKEVGTGDLFLAVQGTGVDSHQFIPMALAQGASVIVVEREVEISGDVTVIMVPSSREGLALLSRAYFGYPDTKLTTVAITGTCGKTTVSYILRRILEENGDKVGLVGSMGCQVEGATYKTNNTTPSAYDLYRFLRMMVDCGCHYAVIEVSSQGIMMGRVHGLTFDYGIFTNLSVDHIGTNEHANYEEYRHYKSLFFTHCKHGIINADSRDFDYITSKATCPLTTYGIEATQADYLARDLSYLVEASHLATGFTLTGGLSGDFSINMAGKFSAYNALSALVASHLLGVSREKIEQGLRTVSVEGRAEIASYRNGYKVIIDYAHNLEEITNLIETISHYDYNKMLCVFGCGGNRPKARRYDFGKAIGAFADLCIITEDNPRFESFDEINEEIIRGLAETNGQYTIVKDRKEGIAHAVSLAQDRDIILLVGKGHENYQEICGVKYPWSEKEALSLAEQTK